MNTNTVRRPPWRQRRWIIPAALLVAIIIVTVILTTISGGQSRTATTAASPAGSCPATSASDAIPTAPPGDLRWQNLGAMLVPVSATSGPARYAGAVWECYAHSPLGAVMAAYDIFAGLASPDWRTVAGHEVVPGRGQRAFIAASQSQAYQAPPPGAIAQAVGFEVVSYTLQQATIEALASAGEDAYQADERTVAWVDGDWKMVLTPDGDTGPDTQLVTSAGGFVLWGSAGNG
jgi:hypothetical protein